MRVFYLMGLTTFWHNCFKKQTQPYCNPYPFGLHPEAIAFFDLKSQNKNCFSGLVLIELLLADSLGSAPKAILLRLI
jgi:hypothetical protein